MSFVVKIVDNAGHACGWIGRNSAAGHCHISDRNDARVFITDADAAADIKMLRNLVPAALRLVIEKT